MQVNKMNKEIQKILDEDEYPLANPIGFVYTPPPEEDEDDENYTLPIEKRKK